MSISRDVDILKRQVQRLTERVEWLEAQSPRTQDVPQVDETSPPPVGQVLAALEVQA